MNRELLQLSQTRDALFAEYDRQVNPSRTIKAKNRREEMESEIKDIGLKMGLMKGKLRELGCYARE